MSDSTGNKTDHWFDVVWNSPLFLGMLTMIAFAISFSPKVSNYASLACLAVAWFLATRLIYTQLSGDHKRSITFVLSSLVLLLFAAFGFWLATPIKATIAEALPSSTPRVSEQSSPQPSQAVSQNPSRQGKPTVDPLPVQTLTPDNAKEQASKDAQQLSESIERDMDSLISEVRSIELDDLEFAEKAYTRWVDKCLAVLARIDGKLEKFNPAADYRNKFKAHLRTTPNYSEDESLKRSRLNTEKASAVYWLTRLKHEMRTDIRR